MSDELDIERPAELLGYLRQTGRIGLDEAPRLRTLPGGVSNRAVLVERASGEAWVVKQALAKLRVAVDWFSSPARIEREALGLRWLARLAPPGTITPLVFEDRDRFILAMEAVPQPHDNWKTLLLAGRVDQDHAAQFGHLLGTVHRQAAADATIAADFDDRSFYDSLRLEPYYRYAAAHVPAAAPFIAALLDETWATRLTLVHGDYSPKNILVRRGRLILLDHEVAHYGDPAFDLGFGLTHLLSKAHHLPARRADFAAAAATFWREYTTALGTPPWRAGLEERAARHTLACLLARVAGRSPLEYLDAAERARQQAVVVELLQRPPTTIAGDEGVIARFVALVGGEVRPSSPPPIPYPERSVPMPMIANLSAMEILDSRGRPTVEATCTLASGAGGTASVPSGASTGGAEALELRDGDPSRYGGLGCRTAVQHINDDLADALGDREFDQLGLDAAMITLDGTPNKSRLGANAILAVSLAFARAAAVEAQVPLYHYFADLAGLPLATLPRLTINLFSGGKHAGGQVPIQDVLVVPAAARTIDEALATTYAVYQAAADLTNRKYGTRTLTADEGGLAPPFPDVETMLADAVAAIEAAGFTPGREIALAVDVAASHFYRDGRYHLDLGGDPLDSAGMIAQLGVWLDRYPIVSIEDGLAEEDWAHWPILRERLADRALILGDDFLCTNPARIRRAIDADAASALLLKVNQIGTLSEAAEARALAHGAGWQVTISARSGETEDNWLADLAVGWGGQQLKVGSITQSERLAKYNRLLAIEAATGLPIVSWPTPSHPPF